LCTWNSLLLFFENEAGTALPVDRLSISKESVGTHYQTKPTNIGLGMLSVLGAEKLGALSSGEADTKIALMLQSLDRAERHEGFFYDWYDARSVQKLSKWPQDNHDLDLFLSSVDNAWLAVALLIISQAKPDFAKTINDKFLSTMNFEFFYDQDTEEVRGGYSVSSGKHVDYHYPRDLISEPRIVHWVNAALNSEKAAKIKILKRLLDKNGKVPHKAAGGALFELFMPSLFVDEPYLESVLRELLAGHKKYGDENLGGLIGLSVVDNPNEHDKYQEKGFGGTYPSGSVLSSHGAALAFLFEPETAYASLLEMEKFPGFFSVEKGCAEAVDVANGKVTESRVFVNQAMLFLSLTSLGRYFPHLFANYFSGEADEVFGGLS
jgi:hypothetical protein